MIAAVAAYLAIRRLGGFALRACQEIIDLLTGERSRVDGVVPVAVKAMPL